MTQAYDPDPPAPMPLVVVLLLGALAWGVLALAPELETLLPRTAEQQAVAVAVEQAIVAGQTAAIPHERDSTGTVAAPELAAMHLRVRQAANEVLTGAYRDWWIESMDGVIDREGAESHVFSGGADHFSRWHIEINGSDATVRVRARIFLELSQTLLGPRSIAENVVDFNLHLRRISGSWLVSAWGQEFAPGGGP